MFNETVCSSVPNLPIHIGAGVANIGNQCNNHFHYEVELLKINKGKMMCNANGNICEAKEGEIIFINSLVPHYTSVKVDKTQTVLVQIDADEFSGNSVCRYLSRYINSGENQIIHFKQDNPLTSELSVYIDNIKKEFLEKSPAYDIYIKANIYNILAFLYRHSVLIDAVSILDLSVIEKVLPVLEFIEAHYDEELNLDKISCISNLNQYYFCRLFKKATNTTFTEYLNFVRICKAEKLLSSTQKNIMEISLETGFSSISYFNRTFKKFKNCSPTDYRKIKYAQQ